MMHEEKLYTSYFEKVLGCNRITNAYSGFINMSKRGTLSLMY
jgi:hypothetical protein